MNFFFKLLITSLAGASALLFFNSPPVQASCSRTPYLGAVCWTAAKYCPIHYAEADGQKIAINANLTFYFLLGTKFGGDGRTTFALPDLRGRTITGTGQGTGLSNVTLGQQIGQEQYQLTIANMPTHSHSPEISHKQITVSGSVGSVSETGDVTSPEGALPASRPTSGSTPKARKPYYTAAGDDKLVGMANDSVELSIPNSTTSSTFSGSSPVSLRDPQIALRACIAIRGVYPERPSK